MPERADDDRYLGQRLLGKYQLDQLIARGGMGRVYRATEISLGRPCAVKLVEVSFLGERQHEFKSRFLREAQGTSRLAHPNNITLYDYGETKEGSLFLAMELLEGVSLHRAFRAHGPMPEDRVVHIAKQICRALREAHKIGVLHRDLNPANIFLTERDEDPDFVKVLDYGFVKDVVEEDAQLTETRVFMGSPKYMSPEQIRGVNVDARTDIYSLGVILFELLSGKVPFDGPSAINTLMAHISDEIPSMASLSPPMGVSTAMEHVVRRCLAKNPEDRFASMDNLLSGLNHFAAASVRTSYGESIPPDRRASFSPRSMSDPIPPQPAEPQAQSFPLVAIGNGVFVPDLDPRGSEPDTAVTKAEQTWVRLAPALGIMTALFFLFAYARWNRSRVSVSLAPPSATALPGVRPESVPSVAISVSHGGPKTSIFRTSPAGAMVFESNQMLCSSTPCDLTWANDQPRRLTLHLRGYKKVELDVDPETQEFQFRPLAPVVPTSTPIRPLVQGADPVRKALPPEGVPTTR